MMPIEDWSHKNGKLIDVGLKLPELQTIYHHLIFIHKDDFPMGMWWILVNPPMDNWKINKDMKESLRKQKLNRKSPNLFLRITQIKRRVKACHQ